MVAVSAPFIPGLELSERFYLEAVVPVLDRYYPDLPHAAARIGAGSEVLGYDTARSADHEWGPRLQLILAPADADRHGAAINESLSRHLPKTFLGYPTNFATTGEAGDIRQMRFTTGPVHHRVEVTDAPAWFAAHLGFDPTRSVTTLDWLATPWQRLLEFTAGAVFRDDYGDITSARRRLRWYPADVGRYVLACQWQRIAQEEAFPGRCAEVGDELGSANVTARLVRDIMRLWLLIEGSYPPYSKWLGTAFARQSGTGGVAVHLAAAQRAADSATREDHLVAAYEATAARQNELLPEAVEATASTYFERPFRVIHGHRFVDALLGQITDDALRGLPRLGSVDQWVDSTDALGRLEELRAMVQARVQPGRAG
jgi:hypothetical protein